MNEISLIFGVDRHLVGTLTMPISTAKQPVAFLLFNAGVIHRIGAHRINVKLARQLASLGFASLRFDLSGQGDSSSPQKSAPLAEQAVLDIRAAMDHLSRTVDVTKFAIIGICSAADHGWATAQQDPRLKGLFMIDGYFYSTPKTARVRLQQKLSDGSLVSKIGRALIRQIQKMLTRPKVQLPDQPGLDDARPFPSLQHYADTMQSLVDRGVSIYLLFSGSLSQQYNYTEQFSDAFSGHAFLNKVHAAYCPDIDHTITPLGAQQDVLQRVSHWAKTLVE
jgi:dienelactone hydrolase